MPVCAIHTDGGTDRPASCQIETHAPLWPRYWRWPAGATSFYDATTERRRRAPTGQHLIGLALAIVDCLAVFAAVSVSCALYDLAAPHDGRHAAAKLELMLAVIFFFASLIMGHYQIGSYLTLKGRIGNAASTWTFTMIAFVSVLLLGEMLEDYDRFLILSAYVGSLPVIVLARTGLVRAISFASRAGHITVQRISLTGGRAEVMSFIDKHEPMQNGFAIVDVALLRTGRDSASTAADLAGDGARCRAFAPDAVVIAEPCSDKETLDACLDAFMNLPVSIDLVPERIIGRFNGSHVTGSARWRACA